MYVYVYIYIYIYMCSDLQNKKGNILEASVDYIRKLQTDEKRLHQMKKQQEELEKQNRRLHLQIQVSLLSPQ